MVLIFQHTFIALINIINYKLISLNHQKEHASFKKIEISWKQISLEIFSLFLIKLSINLAKTSL